MSAEFENARQFERWYAANTIKARGEEATDQAIGRFLGTLHERGRYGTSCDCEEESCTGWKMAHPADLDYVPPPS